MSAETCIVAIDPGLTGAVAFYFPSAPDRVAVEDMPTAGGEIDTAALVRRIKQMGPTIAVIEQVHAMPKNGSIACFKLGMAYGAARAALTVSGVPTHLVTPNSWKKHMRLPGGDLGKEAGRAMAIRLFPATSERFERKKDHNRADAALIAAFAADKLISSTTAARSGCAGDGEAAASASPELGA
ncbi:hypothetical protein LPC10_01835 [Methylorubrum sp. B1-46]|uniref:hypothetical protein n=1 Tax=Methylorubrum sp. B1-46 TaxID=2897334 RepID=UPI001E4ECF18|nr:hypothetical protein [Methylorubrum sp. B1-46]UGB26381.1 hypothetical protein LPC10_01835 [Methylorubrum sp. B1-46]